MDTVISTSELLEMILLKVDMRTLLNAAQRVCLRWRNLITGSPKIQQALFFRPIQIYNHDGSGKERRQRARQNPLIAELFKPWFNKPVDSGSRWQPLLPQTLPMAQPASKRAAFLRAGASWQRMLVQQPPVRSILRVEVISAMGGTTCVVQSLALKKVGEGEEGDADGDGLRMGTLYDLTRKIDARDYKPVWRLHFDKGDDDDAGSASNSNHVRRLLNEFVGRQSEAVLASHITIQCVMGLTTEEQLAWTKDFKREETEHIELEQEFRISTGRRERGYTLEGPAVDGRNLPDQDTAALYRGLTEDSFYS